MYFVLQSKYVQIIGGGMVWQVGGPKGHGAELMINIAIVSMHAILYIDILGPTFVMSGGAMAPLAPPVLPPMQIMCIYVHQIHQFMH